MTPILRLIVLIFLIVAIPALSKIYSTISLSSTTEFLNIVYYPGGVTLSNTTFTNLIVSNLGSTIYLGAYSNDENSYGSTCTVSLVLEIDFAASSFSIDNNFTTSNGKDGKVNINNVENDAPVNFTDVNDGTSMTLLAESSQTDAQGYQRVWNTSGVNLSNWSQNKNGTNTFKTNNIQYGFNVSSGDQGSTYIANLKRYAV